MTPVGTAGVDTCSLNSGCLFEGEHVAGSVPHDPNNPGDILIISAFGPHAQIQVYEWVGVGNAPSPCFTQACSLVPLIPATAGQECGVNTTDDACARVNAGTIASPWTITQKGAPRGTPLNSILATDFFEGGIDLNNLGLAGACFSSFLMNTRASASGDAELHDKVIGQFQRCAPTMGTQASTNGEVTPGTAVTDRATVTVSGASSPADAAGSVTFFLCKVASPNFCTTGGNQIGTTGTDAERPLANANCSPVSPSNTDGISCAVSLTVNDSGQTGNRGTLDPGRYCFRAEASLTNYDNPDAFSEANSECFTVSQTPTSISTNQKWLPQDSATVSPNVAGTVEFTLYVGSLNCGASTATATFTGVRVGTTAVYETANTTYYASPGKTISWSATFTPTDQTTYLNSTTTRCETSVLTITDDSGPFPSVAP